LRSHVTYQFGVQFSCRKNPIPRECGSERTAILHRKNALFYKTQNGARVGDLFMSLIYTCQLNGVNPFDYLTQLQRHADQVAASPEVWMPWNYRAALT
jgi:hypothetical protein